MLQGRSGYKHLFREELNGFVSLADVRLDKISSSSSIILSRRYSAVPSFSLSSLNVVKDVNKVGLQLGQAQGKLGYAVIPSQIFMLTKPNQTKPNQTKPNQTIVQGTLLDGATVSDSSMVHC